MGETRFTMGWGKHVVSRGSAWEGASEGPGGYVDVVEKEKGGAFGSDWEREIFNKQWTDNFRTKGESSVPQD